MEGHNHQNKTNKQTNNKDAIPPNMKKKRKHLCFCLSIYLLIYVFNNF